MPSLPVEVDSFRHLLQARLACPLCGNTGTEYEFVIDRAAYSQCPACRLLFRGGPSPQRVNRADGEQIGSIVTAVSAVLNAYAGTIGDKLFVAPASAGVGGMKHAADIGDLDADASFDAILVAGTLERHDDPIAFLAAIRSRLRPNGVVAIMVPSTASDAAKSQHRKWTALASQDRFYFSPDNLQLLSSRCGFGDFIPITDARDMLRAPNKCVVEWFRSNALLVCRPADGERARGLLSVIFPVYNEEQYVEASLERVLAKRIPNVEIEVVVVESNSTDASREIVRRYETHPRVRLVLEDRPRGKGYAVRTGIRHASGEVILFQDADLEYDVGDYDCLVAPLFERKRNFVLGSRHNVRGNAWKIREFADQRTVATITNLAHVALLTIFNALYRQRLQDPFTMYKVFRRECLFGLEFECNRFDFDFEICIKLLRKGYQPLEIPINYQSRSFKEGKKVSFFTDPPTWLRAMAKLRRAVLYPMLRRS